MQNGSNSKKRLHHLAALMVACLLVGLAVAVSVQTPVHGQQQQLETLPPKATPLPSTRALGFQGERCRSCAIRGVDCADCVCGPEQRWKASRPIPWQMFAQGEYVGPARPAHVPDYRLRVDDEISFIYRLTRDVDPTPYKLNVGDTIDVESLQDENLDRTLEIQPDGTVTLRLLGQVRAAGLSVEELRERIQESYLEFYKDPAITVTPIAVNTKLKDLRNSIDNRQGIGGQSITTTVSPDGTVQLPALNSVPAQGLTIDELNVEVDERYRRVVEGIEVTPVLIRRAARFVFVLGEVNNPGRYELTGPTTAMQSLAMAGGWINGGNLREIVVFRRAADWRLMATRLDLRGGVYGKRPIPADEIWLRDSDIVLVPQTPLKRLDDLVELVFFRGINEVLPIMYGFEVLTPTVF